MSVPRALHFAYLIQAYEAAPESIMAKVLRTCVEECDVWEPRKARTVDFSGLSPLEIRAECAGIRAAVVRVLPRLECAVIQARYELTDYTGDGGERRFFFSRERVHAIQTLGHWAHMQYSAEPLPALDLIVARCYASRRTTPITLRAIAEAFGKSHTHWGRVAHRIEEQLVAIESRALDTLTPHFTAEQHGHSLT